jgi:hypothetical protein
MPGVLIHEAGGRAFFGTLTCQQNSGWIISAPDRESWQLIHDALLG